MAGTRGRSPKAKRSKKQIADDFKDICQWRSGSKPKSWREIADLIADRHGIEISHVTLYREYYVKCSSIVTDARDAHIERELAEIQYQIDELTDAWHRSCGNRTRKKIKTVQRGIDKTKGDKKPKRGKDLEFGESTEKEIIEENLIGDPSIQAQITRLRELRMRLLGLLVNKNAFTDGDGDDVDAVVVVHLPDNGRTRTN